MIPVTIPYTPNVKKYTSLIRKVNKNAWYTNFGPLHTELTNRLEDYLGVENLLLVSNGTLALQIAYKTLNLRGSVLTTPFSFVATTSSLVWEGLKPVYLDINNKTLNLDSSLLPNKLARDTTGLLAVHVYGNPADLSSNQKYCTNHNLKLIYDGAHAFGVKKDGRSILLDGDATTLSFHATKVFHTVEGGAIIFKKRKDFERAKQLINFGMDHKKNIVGVGINSKLNEYQSAVGLVVLDEIDNIIDKRRALIFNYYKKLKDYVEMPLWDDDVYQTGAYAPVILKNEKSLLNTEKKLAADNIQIRRYFYPSLNTIKSLSGEKCPLSEDISRRIMCLPIYYDLSFKDQSKVISKFIKSIS